MSLLFWVVYIIGIIMSLWLLNKDPKGQRAPIIPAIFVSMFSWLMVLVWLVVELKYQYWKSLEDKWQNL